MRFTKNSCTKKRNAHFLMTTLIAIYSIIYLFTVIHHMMFPYLVLPALETSFILSLGTDNHTQIHCYQPIGEKKWNSGLKSWGQCVNCYNTFTFFFSFFFFLRTKETEGEIIIRTTHPFLLVGQLGCNDTWAFVFLHSPNQQSCPLQFKQCTFSLR